MVRDFALKSGGQTPLHYAAKAGLVKIARLLIRHGATQSLLVKDDLGRTPLELARVYGPFPVVEVGVGAMLEGESSCRKATDSRDTHGNHVERVGSGDEMACRGRRRRPLAGRLCDETKGQEGQKQGKVRRSQALRFATLRVGFVPTHRQAAVCCTWPVLGGSLDVAWRRRDGLGRVAGEGLGVPEGGGAKRCRKRLVVRRTLRVGVEDCERSDRQRVVVKEACLFWV